MLLKSIFLFTVQTLLQDITLNTTAILDRQRQRYYAAYDLYLCMNFCKTNIYFHQNIDLLQSAYKVAYV